MLIDRVKEELNLLLRHIEILKIAKEKGPIGMGKISDEANIPKHKVRYSLRVLEKEDLIEPTNEGAVSKNIEEFTKNFKSKIQKEIDKLERIEEILESFK